MRPEVFFGCLGQRRRTDGGAENADAESPRTPAAAAVPREAQPRALQQPGDLTAGWPAGENAGAAGVDLVLDRST
jgi:hypothetical protein